MSTTTSRIKTSLVGSYPQPDWLIDRGALGARLPPRVRARELWRVDLEWLRAAQDDAVILAIRDQERAGLDIVTDGEIRRESYSNQFATALDGLDLDNPATIASRAGTPALVPRVVGPISRRHPVHVEELTFLRANTDRQVKVTLPGPFTMSQQVANEFYEHEEELAFAYADAVREELVDLFAAGADIVQLDEPWLEARPEAARRFALAALERALDGVRGTTALHVCFGYAAFVADRPPAYAFLPELARCPVAQVSIESAQPRIDPSIVAQLPGKTVILGVVALDGDAVETPEAIADRLRGALAHTTADMLVAAPDCGMKYLSRATAYAKLEAMVAGAAAASAGP